MPESKRTKDEKLKVKPARKKQNNAETRSKEKSTEKSDNKSSKEKTKSKESKHRKESLCAHIPCDPPVLELVGQKNEEKARRFGGDRYTARREREAEIIRQQEEKIQSLEDQNQSLVEEIYILLEKQNKHQSKQVSVNPALMLPRSEVFKEEEEREIYFNAVCIPCLDGILSWVKDLYHKYNPSGTKIEFSIAGAPNVLKTDVLLQKMVLEYLRKYTDGSIIFDFVILWGWPKLVISGNNQKEKREIEATIKINGERDGSHRDLTQMQKEAKDKRFQQQLRNQRNYGFAVEPPY